MKRMYVILGVIFLALVWAITSLGQKDVPSSKLPFDRAKRRMELREEMHRKMMEKLLNGDAQADMFQDMEQMFDEALKDSFGTIESISEISGLESNFKSEWKENKNGRVLELTPQEGQQLDIDVKADAITIKGKTEKKSQSGMYSSSFSNSFPIPPDCDGSKVKISQKDSRILVELPFQDAKSIKRITPNKSPSENSQERNPLPPSDDAIEI